MRAPVREPASIRSFLSFSRNVLCHALSRKHESLSPHSYVYARCLQWFATIYAALIRSRFPLPSPEISVGP